MLRILYIFLIMILCMQCNPKPYQPNYNKDISHNDVVKNRNAMVQRQAEREIKRANKQRKKERKKHSAKKLQKKAEKYSKKLVR